jgi:exosortase
MVAFVWLVWQRWPEEIRHTWASRLAGWTFTLLGLAALVVAVGLHSPWVGTVAAVLAVGGLLFLFAGRDAFDSLLPVWLLLYLIIPPPFRLDLQLIHELQAMTSHTSTKLLDFVGVNHLLEGNVFHLPTRRLFVAEACSGIHSQLVLIAASILLVILLRRTWLHAILLIVASICFSTLINVIRVTSVVFVAAHWDLYWTDGWKHNLLGYSLTLAGLFLLISADLLLAGLLAPVLELADAEDELSPEGIPLPTDPLSRLWNLVVARISSDAIAASSEEVELSPGELPSSRETVAGQAPTRRWSLTGLFLFPVAVAFCCLGLLHVLVLLRVPESAEVPLDTVATELQEDWLPSELGGWQCREYEVVERETGSDAGQFSRVWLYESGDRTARVSADFPFLGWHELTNCFTSIGWTKVSRTVYQDDALGPFVEVVFLKPAGEVGHLYFSNFDAAGRPIEPRATHWQGWRGKLAHSPLWNLLGRGEQHIIPSETTIQFQLFHVSQVRVDEEQRQETRALYLQFRREFSKGAWGTAEEE